MRFKAHLTVIAAAIVAVVTQAPNLPWPAPVEEFLADHLPAAVQNTEQNYMHGDAHGPARWDGCAAIPYRINLDRAPAGAKTDVGTAVKMISDATGLTFRYAGSSDVIPTEKWDTGGSGTIVFAWATPDQTDVLSEVAHANGGAGTSEGRYVSGSVVLNSRFNDVYRSGRGPGRTRVNLIAHELAHVVGLDHTDDPTRLMNPSLSDMTPDGPSAADLAGLRKLGPTGCGN
jgi:hypothetical protein